MSKFKRWLYSKYLPAYCKEDLMEANAALSERLSSAQRENERLLAYIDGMEAALRRRQKIIINGSEVRRE